MATLSVENIVVTGLNATDNAAAGGGDDFANDGEKTFVNIKNGSGGAITVTFDDTGSVEPEGSTQFDPDVEVSVPASGERLCGPFPLSRFGKSVGMTYSGVTSLTVAVLKLP